MPRWRRNSERHLSADFLEYLQESTYDAYGIRPPVYDAAFLDQKVAEMVATQFPDSTVEERVAVRQELAGVLQERIDRAPSRFEDPLRYAAILDLAAEVERAATGLRLTLRERPLLGTLPSVRSTP